MKPKNKNFQKPNMNKELKLNKIFGLKEFKWKENSLKYLPNIKRRKS